MCNNKILYSLLFILIILCSDICKAQTNYISTADTIENFDDGEVILYSWADQDLDPSSWSLSSSVTYNNSPYSLRLYGNTWKLEIIEPYPLKTSSVWQVAAFIQSTAEIQGFGITDSVNTLFYSFAGTEQLNTQQWITVYQGAFANNTWNRYLIPVGSDWMAKFGYLPIVKGIIFINDKDNNSVGSAYFDEILDITRNLPITPEVSIQYSVGKIYKNTNSLKSIDVQFNSVVYDPDSEIHTYFWNFGDGSTSILQNPVHTFIVEDDHDYTVFLKVTDETGRTGTASCKIKVDYGPGSLPIRMNFVGDIILARRIQTHINNNGYQSLFNHIAPYLGEAADITIANLESPLTTSNTVHPTKPILLKGSPAHAAALSYGGIDMVTLANNHIIDYGIAGLQQTQSVVRNEGILCFGAGVDSYEALMPAFYSKSGLNLALLGNSNRTGQYNNYQPYLDAGFNKPGFGNLTESNIRSQINSVRNVADIVIMNMHSGSEYSLVPGDSDSEAENYSPYLKVPAEGDREIRRYAIDQGADAVICHHPHIIHGFEVYNKKLIAHSLGNFIFDLDYPETYPSMILNAEVFQEGILKYTVTPVYIDDYIPKRASGQLGLYLLDDLAKKSYDLNTYLKVDRDQVIAEIILDTTTIKPGNNYSKENISLKVIDGTAVSDPILLNKSGSVSEITSLQPNGSWQFRLGRELIWFGNFEDEGCSLWEIDSQDEWYDSTQSLKGLRSFCQKRTAGQTPIYTNLEERILFYSDTSVYTLYSYIKTDVPASSGVAIQFYTTRTAYTPFASVEINSDITSFDRWKLFTADFNLPSNARFINLRLRTNSPQSGTAYSRFDNTGVIEWTSWENFTPYTQFSYPNDYYWIQIRNNNELLNGILHYTETSFINSPPTGFENSGVSSPGSFILYQNYPNPFNPSTTIEYEIPFTAAVNLKIFNILGQEVATLVNQVQQKGKNNVVWNGKDNSGRMAVSGVYFYRLETSGYSLTKKFMLLK
jgi:poly-gamma-glutamate capsule biosynthesis protein CapA/YwtB (metallophosphatase superfamily)